MATHLEHLGAQARPAGSAAAAEARDYCAGVLKNAGFVVTERSFEYSEFVGAWATPLGGLVAALAGIGLYLGRRAPALTILSVVALAVTAAALGYLGRDGVLDFPARRRTGVNLEATRGDDEPAIWLVAHIDSKWQPVSMIARVLGVVVTTLGLIGLLVLAMIRGHELLAAVLLVATWLGSTPLMLSIVGTKNQGTLDNASGVAAVLEAVEAIPSTARVGVLITDAEELGLAGARAWVRGRGPGVALNCDSVDDRGRVTVMHGSPAPAALLARIRNAASAQREPLRVLRLIPGILTDHVPLAEAGWQTVTLSRGDLRTLGRIHTSRDTPGFMRGTGIASVAGILARTATELG
ncbi:MAG: peptidase [Gemmatimonadetes bacterium]|nr:peptidase [Gemmatimonadota bacterium]